MWNALDCHMRKHTSIFSNNSRVYMQENARMSEKRSTGSSYEWARMNTYQPIPDIRFEHTYFVLCGFLRFSGISTKRISPSEFRQCPNPSRILKYVEILLEFGQRCQISTTVRITPESWQSVFLLGILLSIFHQNSDSVYDLYFFLLSTFRRKYNNILINYIYNIC